MCLSTHERPLNPPNKNKNCKYISMGMSNDYEIAIAEGATHVRIGVGLFGKRPK